MSRKLNVFHLVLSLRAGGLERVVHDLVSGLDRETYDVHIGCLHEGGPLFDHLVSLGIPGTILEKRPGPVDMALVRRLRRYFRDHRIDVLHTHSGCMMYGALSSIGNRHLSRVHTDHGRFFPEPRQALIEERIFCRAYQRVIAVSHPLARYLQEVVHIPERKVMVILNGVDTNRFKPIDSGNEPRAAFRREQGWPDDAVVFGVVARFFPVKNLPLLVKAVEILRDRRPGLRLLMLGDGPERQNLMDLVESNNLGSTIQLMPWSEESEKFYRLLDVFVLPSLSEGTSMTILEAMASALPVIASRVGGNPDIVQMNQTGVLFESNNVNDLVAAMERLFIDHDERCRMGKAGREFVLRNYSLDGMLNRYSELYQRTSSRKEAAS